MMKIYVNHYGWVIGIARDGQRVTGLKFTKHKEGAKPFRGDWDTDPDLFGVLYYIENALKCHVDRVKC